MAVIGIESSAHTFGVGIVDNGKVVANAKAMYKIGSKGMIPREVAETHLNNAANVIQEAVQEAGITFKEIEGIGYTKGPGIGHCLHVGLLSAKTLAKKLNIPIVPVNHGIGHIEIAKKRAKLRDPLALYVSGGNSQILKKYGDRYKILGETFDIGIGNMLDSLARSLELYPAWGSTVEKTAENGRYIEMPYTVKGMDFSFTGLLTHASKMKGKHNDKDICFSVQETAYAMLTEATERALLLTNSKELCVCGGVAQSKRLKRMLKGMAEEHNIKFGYAEDTFNADNGAMIALVAEQMLAHGRKAKLQECGIEQRYRIDEVKLWKE
jgi:glycoprotease/Kae1 family metallohydrolase